MGIFDKLFGKKSDENDKPQAVPDQKIKAVSNPPHADVRISCDNCSGYYKIKEGKYGAFAGCSHYPSCKSTLSLPDLILRYIQNYGLNIYHWEKECYRCRKKTLVYSYYLDYDLADLDELFSMGGPTVGLGDLSYVDELLSKQIPTIQLRYSNTIKSKYMANVCEHCGALQGRNYVVDDPHEIIGELWHDRDMEKFLYTNIEIKDTTPLKMDIKRLYAQEE
jgi:ssDNA-binding Zn-finger/Zn-ribbon topoisomerase 1